MRLDNVAHDAAWLESLTPMGTQTRSKGPAAYGRGCAPVLAVRGQGGHVWDETGKAYIDWVCGLGAVGLGYCESAVDQAVHRQLKLGVSFSLPTSLEGRLIEQLREVIPCMAGDGMARFVKTGSEACSAAVRIARKATGRERIVTIEGGYHGWHSWAQGWKVQHPGVPDAYEWLVSAVPYNDKTQLYDALHAPEKPACFILEPTLFTPPDQDYLELARDICADNDIVLIFDEMVTGFRLALGGGQERFGVVPDLACFGKAMANGFPLSMVCGKRELMVEADVISGTFGGETISLAAALATLAEYKANNVCAHMGAIGEALQVWLRIAARNAGFPQDMLRCDGWPEVCRYRFECGETNASRKTTALFVQEMARRGVLWHPNIRYVCGAHSDDDVQLTHEAAIPAFRACADALAHQDWGLLEGDVPEQAFARAKTT